MAGGSQILVNCQSLCTSSNTAVDMAGLDSRLTLVTGEIEECKSINLQRNQQNELILATIDRIGQR